ncbi:MAG: TonB-dependent receptor [Parvularculaceae bacterium]
MKLKDLRLAALTSAVAFGAGTYAAPAFAQDAGADTDDTIVITGIGSRAPRSAADTPAPVDVIKTDELTNQGDSDLSDILRTSVPSYNVNTQPISDAATLVRPANLRGLSPDNTLVLLNGKRRHRAAVISFLGGGISDGAQGPDISAIPAIALKQVEVLRDGASSQYGSDAIAGVMNFVLKDASSGGSIEAKYGSTYEGDGDQFQIAGNIGMPLGEMGFVNVSAEWREADATSRSVQRDDAAALIAAGNTAVADPAQIWGQPNINDDYKIFINSAIEMSDNAELYVFGNYGQRQGEGGFFFRNPTNRGGVYAGPQLNPATFNTVVVNDNGTPTDDTDDFFEDSVTAAVVGSPINSVRVGDLSVNDTGDCPAGLPLTGGGGLIPDPTVLASLDGTNCFSFVQLHEGGFTPRFGGDLEDSSFAIGVRGNLGDGDGLAYDVSYHTGENSADFFINNTINASLGPNQPAGGAFKPGGYTQKETNFNLDVSYPFEMGLASPLTLSGGYEWREEEFTITAGDPLSFEIGPLAAPSSAYPAGQGFSSSSNGFGGFTPASAGARSQSNTAFYVEADADVSDQLTLQGAVRYEDYDTFGDTTNYKIGALFKATDGVRFRGTYSTGFHAPTAGQANVTNVTTAFNGNVLVDQGTIPLSSTAGQFIADFIVAGGGDRPTLGPEDATNLSLGAAFDLGEGNLTVDLFRIEVEDRISISEQQDFIGALQTTATNNAVAFSPTDTTSQLLNLLDTAGVLNASDFAGSEDLTSFAFFNNDFDTETSGIDIVYNTPVYLTEGGDTTLTAVVNYTKTEVTRLGGLGATRLRQLEENIPNWRGNLTMVHDQGPWRALGRVNYYGEFYEAHLDSGGLPIDAGSEITLDAEFGYSLSDNFEVSVGARNLLDSYPDDNPHGGVAGAAYPVTAPGGFTGGSYYIRGRLTF